MADSVKELYAGVECAPACRGITANSTAGQRPWECSEAAHLLCQITLNLCSKLWTQNPTHTHELYDQFLLDSLLGLFVFGRGFLLDSLLRGFRLR